MAQFFAAQKLAPRTRQVSADVAAKGKAITQANSCVQCHAATPTGQHFDGTMTSAAQALAPP